MTKKILRSIILVTVLTLVLSMMLTVITLNSLFIKKVEQDLESEAQLAALGVELVGVDYFSTLDTPNRITWIAPDGTILYDSVFDINKLSNHSDREEFIEAKKDGIGMSQRYSDTLASQTINYALLVSDSSVVRISSEQHTIWALLASSAPTLLIVFSIVLILSLPLSVKLSKNIVKPINDIDLGKLDTTDPYKEISPLLHKIKRQNELISAQMADLRKASENFQTITKNMSEGIIILDNDLNILSYNRASVHLLGASNVSVGENIFSLNSTKEFKSCIENAVNGKNGKAILSGKERTYQLLANPVTSYGEINGVVIVILDVTERERGEAMRREFTSNVSHELKTPLTSIYGISEIMANGIVKKEDIPKFAKDINSESGRLITLVNDIIRLSQLDENTFAEQKEPVDLFGIANEVASHLSSAASEKNISITLDGESTTVTGIYSVLYEMIYNLCDNAIKYNRESGTVSVTVSATPTPTLTVSDSGIGIPSEHLSRVFERFYRVDKSHSKAIGGTGLGLSIVKHAAAFHGADISIKSKVDVGTTVKVSF